MSRLADALTIRINARLALYAPIAVLVTFLVVAYPLAAVILAAWYVVLLLLTALLRRAGLEVWHVLAMMALTGYIVLNWGFANLAFRIGGIPLIIGHALMFAALALAAFSNPNRLVVALREPATLCLLGLIVLSSFHLVLDVPRYGLYALRDSSLFLEGIFLLLGLLWGKKPPRVKALLAFLFVVFGLNLVYSLTFFWGEWLSSWSPKSGIFQAAPLLGSYAHNYLYLLAGTLFCLWLARHVVRAPRWVFLLLAAAQLFGLAVHQARSMYAGIAIVLLALLLLGELRKWGSLVTALSLAVGLLVVASSFTGTRLAGRVGPVTVEFLEEHAQSLALQPGTPALGTVYDRWEWYKQTWEASRARTATLLVGQGFGEPLIDFHGKRGVKIRQPHNTHLSVLARLGLVGMGIWVVFHVCVALRLLKVLVGRCAVTGDAKDIITWFLAFYLLSIIVTTVQPHLEFSYGAIPFYSLTGVGLALAHSQR